MADFDDFDVDDFNFDESKEPSPQANKRTHDDAGLGIDEQVSVAKRPRAPAVKLDEARLLSDKGIPELRRRVKKVKFKGKGHEVCPRPSLPSARSCRPLQGPPPLHALTPRADSGLGSSRMPPVSSSSTSSGLTTSFPRLGFLMPSPWWRSLATRRRCARSASGG